MSKRAQLKAAKKRANRTVASVKKRKEQNREFVSHAPIKSSRWGNNLENIRVALDNRKVKEAMNQVGGVTQEDLSGIDTEGLIKNTRTAIGDLFKLFSFVSLGITLGKQNKIEYTPSCNIYDVARSMTHLDEEYTKLEVLVKTNPEEFISSVFDMGSEMETRAQELYKEVEILDAHQKVIAAAIDNTARELVVTSPELTMEQARIQVTEAVAYAVLEEATVTI